MGAPFVWYDVTATAAQADTVREIYGTVLGWTIGPDTSPGPYNGWITDGDQPWASVIEAGDATAGRWVPYVQVDDLDTAVDKAVSLGGPSSPARPTDRPAPRSPSPTPAAPSSPSGSPFPPTPDHAGRAIERSVTAEATLVSCDDWLCTTCPSTSTTSSRRWPSTPTCSPLRPHRPTRFRVRRRVA